MINKILQAYYKRQADRLSFRLSILYELRKYKKMELESLEKLIKKIERELKDCEH